MIRRFQLRGQPVTRSLAASRPAAAQEETLEIDQLLGFSEIALALAGFAAIALVLGRREGVLPSGSAYVVRFMVVNALGPALLALFAFVLQLLGVPEPALWRLCSGLYLVVAVFLLLLSLRQERELKQSGELLLPKTFARAMWGGALLAHVVQVSNLVGYPTGPSAGVFLLGLWVLLSLAAVQFVTLLFLSLR
jgi:hypothetical protein